METANKPLKIKINFFLTFSPHIFLIPSDARSKNKEVLRKIPAIHIPRYNESKCCKEPNLPILAAVYTGNNCVLAKSPIVPMTMAIITANEPYTPKFQSISPLFLFPLAVGSKIPIAAKHELCETIYSVPSITESYPSYINGLKFIVSMLENKDATKNISEITVATIIKVAVLAMASKPL